MPAARLQLAALALVAAVFARGLWGAFVYDDLVLIVGNPGLHDPFEVVGLWSRPLWGDQLPHWRPLTAQLLALGWWLGNGTPWAIHALALLLHLAACLAIPPLWRRLGGGARGAIAAMLLFALHPAQAEAVGWCASLNDVLWGACALHAVAAWLRWRDTGARRDLALAWLGAAAAMLAKEAGVAVPLLFVANDIAAGRWRACARAHLGSLLLLGGYFAARIAVFGDAAGGLLRATHTADGAAWVLPLQVAAGLGARLAWPVGRTMFDGAATLGAVDVALALALLAAITVAVRRGGVRTRLAALLLLASTLPPILGAAALGPYPFADRYLYVAAAGLALLVAQPTDRRSALVRTALVAAFAAGTFAQLGTFRDQDTFAAHAVALRPDDPVPHYLQGQLQLARAGGGDAAALAAAERSFATAAQHLETANAKLRADVANALAWCRLQREQALPRPDWAAVEQHFAAVVRDWPDCADAWVGLGAARASLGRFDDAEQAFSRALELDPGTGAAHHNLARLLLQRGRTDAARGHLIEALRLQPGDQASQQLLDAIDRGRGR